MLTASLSVPWAETKGFILGRTSLAGPVRQQFVLKIKEIDDKVLKAIFSHLENKGGGGKGGGSVVEVQLSNT